MVKATMLKLETIKRLLVSALFPVQVIAAWTYVSLQTVQVLSGNTKGLTLAVWLMFVAYLVFSLTLATSSYQKQPTPDRKKTIWIFRQFLVIFAWLFIIGCKHIKWTTGDTLVIVLILVLCTITRYIYKSYSDDIARGQIAMWCKGITQLWMAYVIWEAKSSEGLPPISLLASHITSMPRFIQIYLSGRKDGWDRPTKGLLIGELANVSTWAVVTILWFIMR